MEDYGGNQYGNRAAGNGKKKMAKSVCGDIHR